MVLSAAPGADGRPGFRPITDTLNAPGPRLSSRYVSRSWGGRSAEWTPPVRLVTEPGDRKPTPERRVLGKLVGRYVGTSRALFELGNGRQVEVEGVVEVDSVEAPGTGEKALIVMDQRGRPLRWEPYLGARLRRGLD